MVKKIMRTGYFWPTMQQDAAEFVKNVTVARDTGTFSEFQVNR